MNKLGLKYKLSINVCIKKTYFNYVFNTLFYLRAGFTILGFIPRIVILIIPLFIQLYKISIYIINIIDNNTWNIFVFRWILR